MKRKGFTLIELIAVIVILGILALVVVPLVLNIIRRAKDSTNKRSVDGYGRAVDLAMANYLVQHLTYPDSFEQLEIEYKGSKVECNINRINPDDTIYLSECKVNGKYVKDDKNKDGYYHYGILKMTNQEYVDAYGKNLEDALKKYHDEHNEYPNDYTTLTLPSLDKEVSCNVKINFDGTIYLTQCSVNNEEVLDDSTTDNYYHYGSKEYEIGDVITYNDIDYYVIKNSNKMKDYVTMLKADPLTVEEVNLYGEVHVNRYTRLESATNKSGYGGMAYYTSETCGFINGSTVSTGCNTSYSDSEIKFVVDGWVSDKVHSSDLVVDETGYSARLITKEEYEDIDSSNTWRYNSNFWYWGMSPASNNYVWVVIQNGNLLNPIVYSTEGVVRPVVTLKKSALE